VFARPEQPPLVLLQEKPVTWIKKADMNKALQRPVLIRRPWLVLK